ncbi:hypothetical protein IID20_02635, partial [Patescibacteria group bacterium]|nr:hypothetical protein [Patescibacteria group bacterium]
MMIFLSLATLVTLISPMITESRNQIIYRQFDWQHIKKQVGENKDEFYELWYPKQMEYLQGPTQAIIDQIYADYSQKVFTKFKWYPEKFNSLITDALKQGESINTFSDSAETSEVWYDKARTIVIYPSMQDFTQQRLIWQMISPGVLGFNETTGWRVGIPFPGSYIMFKNVMYHELAHAWMFSFMRQSVKKQELKKFLKDRQRANFPLWFVEGFAEVLNRRYNQDFNPSYLVVMRETMMRNQITDLFQSVPGLARMAGMDVYSFGHSFVNWVVEKYGIEKIIELLAQRTRQQGFGKIWETVFNQKLVDMQIEWSKKLLWYFEPFFTDSMKSIAEKMDLTNGDTNKDEVSFYGHVGYDQFRISYYTGDSKWLARTEVRDLFTDDVWKIHHMFKDKSLYYRFSDPPAMKNNLLALIVNQEGQDELQIYQLGKKKNSSMFWWVRKKNPEITTVEAVNTLRQKNILSIQSPSFNEDGTQIIFEGIADSSGFSDLYIWDLKQNKVERLMQDIYRDAYPRFFKLGEKQVIAFTSDRLDKKKIGLYYLDLETKAITYLYQPTKPGTFIDQLVVSPDNHTIAFRLVSINHSPQVFIWRNSNTVYHVFNSFEGISQVVG